MKVAVVTKIFPNETAPTQAPFNRQQFAALGRLCDVRVFATIPWHPGKSVPLPPKQDTIAGLPVWHPRTLYVPKLPVASAALYRASILPYMAALKWADVWIASWAYPDGAALIPLAKLMKKPVFVKVHGSDLDIVSELPGPRRQLKKYLPRATGVVSVSKSLNDKAMGLGVPRANAHVIANGVDTSLFFPGSRLAARKKLGLPARKKITLFVGNLKQDKGIEELLKAFHADSPPPGKLIVIGDGPLRHRCEQAKSNVTYLGKKNHREVSEYMRAATAIVLPSWHEGMPNVVLEAMATERPVIATSVGGIPELIREPNQGTLVPPKNAEALRVAITTVLKNKMTTPKSSLPSWDDTAKQWHSLLKSSL